LRLAISKGLAVQIPFLSVWGSDIYWLLPALILAVGMLSGAYPAFYLTSLQPVKVLKGRLFPAHKGSNLRNVLVVTQFVISVGFIASTIIVYQQLEYFKQSDLGFDSENVVVVN